MFPYTRYFLLIVASVFLAFSIAVSASPRIVDSRIDTDCSREVDIGSDIASQGRLISVA